MQSKISNGGTGTRMSKLMCGFEQGGGGGGNSKRKEEEHNHSNYLRFSMDISKVYEYFRSQSNDRY